MKATAVSCLMNASHQDQWKWTTAFLSCIAPQQKFNVTDVCTTSRELEVRYVLCSCLKKYKPPEHVTSNENESARTKIYSERICAEPVYSLQLIDGICPVRSASLAVHCHDMITKIEKISGKNMTKHEKSQEITWKMMICSWICSKRNGNEPSEDNTSAKLSKISPDEKKMTSDEKTFI